MSVDNKILRSLYLFVAHMAGLVLVNLGLCQPLQAYMEVRPRSSSSHLFNKQEILTGSVKSLDEIRQSWPIEVPQLHMPLKPDWELLYYGAWRILINNLRSAPPADSPAARTIVSDYIDEGYSEHSLFQWDSIFAVHTARFLGHQYNFVGTLDNFYMAQHSSGFISRELSEETGDDIYFKEDIDYPWLLESVDRRFHDFGYQVDPAKDLYEYYLGSMQPIENSDNPPLFAWAELEYSYYQLDVQRLQQVGKVLELYLERLETEKTRTLAISRNAKDKSQVTLFYQTRLGSGMDNIPLQGDAWIDFSSQMYLSYDQLSRLYQRLLDYGVPDEEDEHRYRNKIRHYRNKAEILKQAINECLWSDSARFYFNARGSCSHKVETYTLASFWPMFAGIADENQAEAMVKVLFDPEHFYTGTPFPALSKTETNYFQERGGYWRGGVWAPTNYMVIRGLMNYGYMSKAREATTRYLDALAKSYRSKHTLYEYYSSNGKRGYDPYNKSDDRKKRYAKANFVGWTGLGPISLMIELMAGIRYSNPNHSEENEPETIYWDLAGTDPVGISNLNFNGKRLSLYKNQRQTEEASATVQVSVEGMSRRGPKKLIIIHHKNRVEVPLEAHFSGKYMEIPAYQ